MNRVIAWAVFLAALTLAVRGVSAWENPFSLAGTLGTAVSAPSAAALHIPGCADKAGCQ